MTMRWRCGDVCVYCVVAVVWERRAVSPSPAHRPAHRAHAALHQAAAPSAEHHAIHREPRRQAADDSLAADTPDIAQWVSSASVSSARVSSAYVSSAYVSSARVSSACISSVRVVFPGFVVKPWVGEGVVPISVVTIYHALLWIWADIAYCVILVILWSIHVM